MNAIKAIGSLSLAYILAFGSDLNIDTNKANVVQELKMESCNADIELEYEKIYAEICKSIEKIYLKCFLLHNEFGITQDIIQAIAPEIEKIIKVSRDRMQDGGINDEKVYYSAIALYSFLESKEIIGGITIPKNFSIVEYGKGVEEARLKAVNV